MGPRRFSFQATDYPPFSLSRHSTVRVGQECARGCSPSHGVFPDEKGEQSMSDSYVSLTVSLGSDITYRPPRVTGDRPMISAGSGLSLALTVSRVCDLATPAERVRVWGALAYAATRCAAAELETAAAGGTESDVIVARGDALDDAVGGGEVLAALAALAGLDDAGERVPQ